MTPSVSVVIVNLDGRSLLPECLDALKGQTYPRDLVEIVLVDNGSTDDSVAFVREAYPEVRIIEAGRNLGFAGGSNLGAWAARGEYLALINNDARAAPDWLSAMMGALEAEDDPQVVCLASKMLSADGDRIDFVGPVMNLYGRAFQIDEGLPIELVVHDEPREILAPCGGAMLIQRNVFLRVGGFDEDYIAYYEDVDLGWRLWIFGYKVLLVPNAIVYHRKHQTGSGFPVEQRYVLSEMNALRTVIKNFAEANLWRVLPFSLFMGVKRSLDQAHLDRGPYLFGADVHHEVEDGISATEPSMTKVATSFVVAIDQIADEMPLLMEKRARVQRMRVRTDEDIFSLFPMRPDNQIFTWRRNHVVQDVLSEALQIPAALQPKHGSRLLIITHEAIGPKMSGPGIRSWEMACALAEHCEVMLAAPGKPQRRHPGVRVFGYDDQVARDERLSACIASADAVLAMGPLFARIPQLRDLNKPAIVDLYDPYEIEKLALSSSVDDQSRVELDIDNVIDLRLEGAIGDFFICAGERQRDFWLGVLLTAGRVNTVTYRENPTLRSLIDVVPFGIPADPPERGNPVLKGVHPGIDVDDTLILWNGGLWQWFDPLTLIEAIAVIVQARDDVKLFFAAGQHFDLSKVMAMPIYEEVLTRCQDLGLLDRYVFFGDWIPYDNRGAYLLEADLAVSVHRRSLETHLSSRTRLLDCLWAGLPIVCTEGDMLGDALAGTGLASTVPPDDPELLAQVILARLAKEDSVEAINESLQPLRTQWRWSQVVEPIAGFLEQNAFASDALSASRTAAEVRQVEEHINRLDIRIRQERERYEAEISRLEAVVVQQREELQRARDSVGHLIKQVRQLEQDRDRLTAHIEDIAQGRVMRFLRAIDVLLNRD